MPNVCTEWTKHGKGYNGILNRRLGEGRFSAGQGGLQEKDFAEKVPLSWD